MLSVKMPDEFGGANVQGVIVEPTADGVVSVENHVGEVLCESFGGVKVPVTARPRARLPLVPSGDSGESGTGTEQT
jgi:hypothetical protein